MSAWGYWGDILNCPYHAFGEVTEVDDFYQKQNRQYVRSAVDIALANVEVGYGVRSSFGKVNKKCATGSNSTWAMEACWLHVRVVLR